MLKLMAAEDSLEEKRLTGTETSPKDIVAEAMDLGAMGSLVRGASYIGRIQTPARRGVVAPE
jgi:hypothetical protein